MNANNYTVELEIIPLMRIGWRNFFALIDSINFAIGYCSFQQSLSFYFRPTVDSHEEVAKIMQAKGNLNIDFKWQ